MIHTFCIAHAPVKLDLPASAHLVWIGNAPPPQGLPCQMIVASEFASELNDKHRYLAGAAGSYVVRKFLNEHPALWNLEDRISIIHYRKFVSSAPLGFPAANYHGCQLLYPGEALAIDIDRVHSFIESAYLLPQIVGVGGILRQYAHGHCVEDFLRYCAFAVEKGILGRDEVTSFFQQGVLIPGGVELGILPIHVFLETIEKLEQVCAAFLEVHKPVSDQPYQSRALAFCNERLGSFLLLKRLTQEFNCDIPGLPSNFFGYMHTVVEPGAIGI